MQVFLDDFDAHRMASEAELKDELGKPAASQLMQHEAAWKVGARISEAKRGRGQLVVERPLVPLLMESWEGSLHLKRQSSVLVTFAGGSLGP